MPSFNLEKTLKKEEIRPYGMTQVPWKNDKELVWDLTVVDTLTLIKLAVSKVKSGLAAGAPKKILRTMKVLCSGAVRCGQKKYGRTQSRLFSVLS